MTDASTGPTRTNEPPLDAASGPGLANVISRGTAEGGQTTDTVQASGTGHVSAAGEGRATVQGATARIVAPLDWDAARPGEVQIVLEQVADLIGRSNLLVVLAPSDARAAAGLQHVFSAFSTDEAPPKNLVREMSRWLLRKLDVALDSAIAIGTAAGIAGAGLLVTGHAQELHHLLMRLSAAF